MFETSRSKAIALSVSIVLMLVLIPAASGKITKCEQLIYYNDYGVQGPDPRHTGETMYWKGTITGDISGTSYYWETQKNYIVGTSEHFFEDFYIALPDGWISGYDDGVWNFATFNFRAQGWVTDASENYEYLIGTRFFEQGTTSNPANGFPVTGLGTCWFGP